MQHKELIQQMTLLEKCALLSGDTVFTTRAYSKHGIPAITLSDGPNGVRKQAGAADHLGLNPSVPATCFPTAATVACSWDPALGEQLGQFGEIGGLGTADRHTASGIGKARSIGTGVEPRPARPRPGCRYAARSDRRAQFVTDFSRRVM